MLTASFLTSTVPSAQRRAYWSKVMSAYFGEHSAHCVNEGIFDACLTRYDIAALQMYLISCPPHWIERGEVRRDCHASDYMKLILPLNGAVKITQGGAVIQLGCGDWGLYDSRAPYRVDVDATEILVMLIPRSSLIGFKLDGLQCSPSQHPETRGLNSVLSAVLRSLAQYADELPISVHTSLAETVLGLLASALAAEQASRRGQLHLPAVLRLRVKHFIAAHITDPELSIDSIAHEMRCSKRYLHRIFEEEGKTIDRYIWWYRLERCRDTLQACAGSKRSISDVAFSWGFNSSAHFGRMFKETYGVVPRDYQREVMLSH
ncbi:helix-turn-helix domain-containing protein [Iodobacter sp. CM08]|uniref:AraC-like ligand-binding domain-containing protein n=1 Tax=Iodobacter sp. CM08 TaxID=3085902 RepID=UPI002982A587|nr:helix-turn-helix domain-containing protein [Iodobacter sp. CM08]MDW5416641.1 helix-turn-helix domain-containing protein [Iodobacter sp. CM08]